jgi:hypothetical protein
MLLSLEIGNTIRYVRKSIKIGEGTAFALKVSLRAESVLELLARAIYRSGTNVGDRLEIAPVR